MKIVMITGLSGAGKTQAMLSFEDRGYYCVDNMPTLLVPEFVSMMNARKMTDKLVLVTDIRAGVQYRAFADTIQILRDSGHKVEVLFLEADNATIHNRYEKTRRAHPLSNEHENLSDSIAVERERMKRIRTLANFTLDTSNLTTEEFQQKFSASFVESSDDRLHIACVSFGYQFGTPKNASFILDVRSLVNPYYIEELKELTGLNEEVREYVLKQPETKKLLSKTFDLIDYLLSLYTNKKRKDILLAIGCSGGKHRSVTLVKVLADHLETEYGPIAVVHRDIDK